MNHLSSSTARQYLLSLRFFPDHCGANNVLKSALYARHDYKRDDRLSIYDPNSLFEVTYPLG
jgi:hypothetical protein